MRGAVDRVWSAVGEPCEVVRFQERLVVVIDKWRLGATTLASSRGAPEYPFADIRVSPHDLHRGRYYSVDVVRITEDAMEP